jgi:hypothetical protein
VGFKVYPRGVVPVLDLALFSHCRLFRAISNFLECIRLLVKSKRNGSRETERCDKRVLETAGSRKKKRGHRDDEYIKQPTDFWTSHKLDQHAA